MIKIALLIMFIFMHLFGTDADGFRDIKWGSKPTKNMILVDKDIHSNSKSYRIKGDKLLIATAKLEGIFYTFFDNRLMSVLITYDGFKNFHMLKETLQKKYGSCSKPNQFIEDYYWHGENSMVAITYNTIQDNGSIYILNKKIEKESDSYKSNIASRGVSDL